MGKNIKYSPLKLARKYLDYFFAASNGKGHGVHSPFVFNFIVHVLNDRKKYPACERAETLRKELLKDHRLLSFTDFGAGSGTRQRKVSEIARTSLKPQKFSSLLHRMVKYYQPQHVLELGTSLGVTTSCLAGATNGTVYTLEGALAVADVAQDNFEKLGLKNIRLVKGNFDETLPGVLAAMKKVEFAFIDGNHRIEPTLRYFSQLLEKSSPESILIFDDIHWSEEMEEAWEVIKRDDTVRLSIDLFFIGIVFFRKEFKVKQHFRIRF